MGDMGKAGGPGRAHVKPPVAGNPTNAPSRANSPVREGAPPAVVGMGSPMPSGAFSAAGSYARSKREIGKGIGSNDKNKAR